MKMFYQPDFEAQLRRALNGHAPWKERYVPVGDDGPTDKQKVWLKKFGKVAKTKAEATRILNQCFAK